MAFNGTEGEQITITEASLITSNHRTTNPSDKIGVFMGKDIINSILAQPECMGIRTYHAMDSSGNRTIVLVGVDENENDMTSGVIADRGVLCPPVCGVANPLNS